MKKKKKKKENQYRWQDVIDNIVTMAQEWREK
jgi:hypothetical protein